MLSFRIAALYAVLACLSVREVSAAEPVAVLTTDGRVVHGVIDVRTDGDSLWLRQEDGPIMLAVSLPWSSIESAEQGGERLDAAALRERSAGTATATEHTFMLPATAADIGQSRTSTRGQRVRNIEILDACLANFDRDVEPDGLAISLAAINEHGGAVPVRGSFTATLFGERRPNDARVVAFPVLDRTSYPVEVEDFVGGVATYRLPFRRTAPEWQFDLMPDAVVEVRLGVFGEGNFAASAPVVIRAFNPLRDDRQLQLKSRFMPRELHGRPPMSAPGSPDGLWFDWTW